MHEIVHFRWMLMLIESQAEGSTLTRLHLHQTGPQSLDPPGWEGGTQTHRSLRKVCLQPHQCDSALIMGCCCSPTVQVLHPSWNAGLRGRSPLQNFIIDTSVFTLWRVTLCEKWISPAFPKMWTHSCHHTKQSESPIWRKRQHLVGCLSQRVKVNFK